MTGSLAVVSVYWCPSLERSYRSRVPEEAGTAETHVPVVASG